MKRAALLVCTTLLFCVSAYSQNSFPASGNVGIGTFGGASIAGNLHVRTYDFDKLLLECPSSSTNGVAQQRFKMSGYDMYLGVIGSGYFSTGYRKTSSSFLSTNAPNGFHMVNYSANGVIRFYTGGDADANERMKIDSAGRVFAFKLSRKTTVRDSILSLDSTGELQVSPLRASRLYALDTRSISTAPDNYNAALVSQLKTHSAAVLPGSGSGLASIVGLRSGPDNSSGMAHELAFTDSSQVYIRSGASTAWGNWRRLLAEDNGGNVVIGNAGTAGKLAVNGEVRARKVKVTATGWPDFVFDPHYQLPDLYTVETYIRQHRHLPGVKSAEEVELQGLDIATNQAALLQKIEELTLYAIQQQKEIDKLESERKSQSELLQSLLYRIQQLEAAH